jgi:hypothetical protein
MEVVRVAIQSAKIAKKKHVTEEAKEADQANNAKRAEVIAARASLPRRILLATSICGWIKDFVATDVYADLVLLQPLHLFGYGRGLQLYHGGWGHKPTFTDAHGCISCLHIKPSGSLCYAYHYKMFPGAELQIGSSTKMASILNVAYLDRLWNFLTRGEVYKYLAEKSGGVRSIPTIAISSSADQKPANAPPLLTVGPPFGIVPLGSAAGAHTPAVPGGPSRPL